MKPKIRKPFCAGSWYSDNPSELSSELDGYLSKVKREDYNVKAIIVPHAGYIFSGGTAAHSYKQLNRNTNKVIILGTAHRYPLKGVCAIDYEYYDSPLGMVKVNESIKDILREKNVQSIPAADEEEHSIEIEIPFLQKSLTDFSIIPLIVGKIDHKEFADLLEKYSDKETVIVTSVDLSHFHDYKKAVELDRYTINCILNLDADGIKNAEIDSPFAVMSLLELAKRKKWRTKLLDYKNSGDVISRKDSVVGYSAIMFYENSDFVFSEEDKKQMLNLAKNSVVTYVRKGKRLTAENVTESLEKPYACFVTITDGKDLRGCIGTLEPVDKLCESIISNAISAASKDYRFEPVQECELPDLNYEVSVLSKPVEINYSDEKDLFKKIKNKGVIIEKSGYRAVYLPQVWEHFKKEEDFLSSLCSKAGLSSNDWKSKNMNFNVFENLVD